MKNDWKKKYLYYGLTLLAVCVVAILFWQLFMHITWVAGFASAIIKGLSSVLIGMFIAYLLNPILVFFERRLYVPLASVLVKNRSNIKNKERFVFKFGRTLSIISTLIVFLGLLWGFMWLVIPQIYKSVISISNDIPTYVTNVQEWITDFWKNNQQQAAWLTSLVNQLTDTVTDFLNGNIIPKLGDLIVNISTGLLGGVKFVFNFVVGIMVSVYVMAGKEMFGAQLKKLLYAIFSRHHANKILSGIRQMDHILGGFINGKIVDSVIIGILCYFSMLALKLPYPVLIAVIVGVTNVIPFFGPFIGAVPSAVIILFVSPMQCLVFVILILVIQQLDGNIIGPLILGDSIGISGFWIIVSISLGASLFGVAGMIFGVPICACIYQLIRYLCNHMLEQKNLPTDSREYMNMERIDRTHHIVERDEVLLAEAAIEEEQAAGASEPVEEDNQDQQDPS